MATIGWVKIGLTTDTSGLAAGLKSGGSMLDAFASKIGVVGAALAGAFAIQKVGSGLLSMIGIASDLSENMNKVQAIFGSGAKTVVTAADQMSAAFGTSKNEFLDAAGRMGGLFKGVGASSADAALLSVQFTKLAADASSFFNVDFDTAFQKIRSGLAGESEPLRDFGVFLTEDTVKAKAYAMGLAATGAELTQLQKVQSRAALITSTMADAQGDLAKTANGAANASRAFMGRIENLAGKIGQAFLPAVEKGLAMANSFLMGLQSWAESSGIIATIGDLVDSLIVTPIEFVVGLFHLAGDALAAVGIDLVGIFTGVLQLVADTVKGLASIVKMFTYAKEEAHQTAAAVAKSAPKPPAAPKTASATALASGIKAHAGGGAAHGPHFAGAVEQGSKESYSAILASRTQFADHLAALKLSSGSKMAAGSRATALAPAAELGSVAAYQSVTAARNGGENSAQSQILSQTRELVTQAKLQVALLKRLGDRTEGAAVGENLATSMATV